MNEKAETIRRAIAAYRSRLAEGAPADVARTYLVEIVKLEAELDEIERAAPGEGPG